MLIAIWVRDTCTKQGKANEDRLARLKAAVEKTAEIRKGVVTRQHWANPEVIFIAPEYLFGRPTGENWVDPKVWLGPKPPNPRDPGRVRHLDEEDKDKIKGKLIALSAKHPEFLIVPGTIAWSVRVKDHPRLLQVAKNRIGHQPDDYTTEKPGRFPADKLARLVSFTNLDARKARKPGAGPHLTKPEEERLNNARLCLNTAFVLYGGDVKFVYSKQGDFYEVLAECKTNIAYQVAIPGDKCGVFEIEGNWYGIEICFDHACGVLHQVPLQTPPLIHLITSATVEVKTDNCVVAPGGYVANAAASSDDAGLWYNDPADGKLKRVESPRCPHVPPPPPPAPSVGPIRLPRRGPRPPNLPPSEPWPPKSYKEYPDVAGSPLWVYRADVP
jgi:hypothetical protein